VDQHDGSPLLLPSGSVAFSSASARAALNQACDELGIQLAAVQLLRMGENAVFKVGADPVVARVARGRHLLRAAEREVRVARWLESEGYPAARVLPDVEQPVIVAGHPITFWEFIDQGPERPTYTDLGRLLHDLHELPVPNDLELPPFDPFGRVAERIEMATAIGRDTQEFLRARQAELRQRVGFLAFSTPAGPVHGDAHVQNLMRHGNGQVVLIDLENFAIGRREWDLMVTGTEHVGPGWVTDQQYEDFVANYGRDITTWDGFEVLRDIQELKMTTWLMQNVSESTAVADEFERRLASIRDGVSRRAWRPF
jgi:aminoglycoside phosphotransferase (APT) family kinase protein